jgi:hypothetical protein
LRAELIAAGDGIRTDVKTLKSTLRCRDDAPRA